MRKINKREKGISEQVQDIPLKEVADLVFRCFRNHGSKRDMEEFLEKAAAALILELFQVKKRDEYNFNQSILWMNKHDDLMEKYNKLKKRISKK